MGRMREGFGLGARVQRCRLLSRTTLPPLLVALVKYNFPFLSISTLSTLSDSSVYRHHNMYDYQH